MPTLFMKEGKAVVSKVKFAELKDSIKKAVELIGGFEKLELNGKNIFIKADLENEVPYPGSTDIIFLKTVVEILKEYKPKKIFVGDSASPGTNTRSIFQEKGLIALSVEQDFELLNFEDEEYETVKNGNKEFSIPKILKQMDRLVFLPNMRTDLAAKFDMSLKLAVGFLEKSDKIELAKDNYEEKIAELAGVFRPDLIIMDARKAFVEGGPSFGTLKKTNLILASGDRIAIDTEALKTLKEFKKADNKLGVNIWELPQIKKAVELGLGISKEEEKLVVE